MTKWWLNLMQELENVLEASTLELQQLAPPLEPPLAPPPLAPQLGLPPMALPLAPGRAPATDQLDCLTQEVEKVASTPSMPSTPRH